MMATTGSIKADAPLRAILIQAALLLRLDVQELESLNSMIKRMIERATTTITLELLSSRVCIKKQISMASGGSAKFAIAKQIGAQLARSCYLFYDNHRDVLVDAQRWAPPTDAVISKGDARLFNPAVVPKSEDLWAVRANKFFMPFFRATTSQDARILVAMLLPDHQQEERWSAFVASEKVRSMCYVTELSFVRQLAGGMEQGRNQRDPVVTLPGLDETVEGARFALTTNAVSSVEAIKRVLPEIKRRKQANLPPASMYGMKLQVDAAHVASGVTLVVCERHELGKLTWRERKPRQRRRSARECLDNANDANDVPSGSENEVDDQYDSGDEDEAHDSQRAADREVLQEELLRTIDGVCDSDAASSQSDEAADKMNQSELAEADELHTSLLVAASNLIQPAGDCEDDNGESSAFQKDLDVHVDHSKDELGSILQSLSPDDQIDEALLQQILTGSERATSSKAESSNQKNGAAASRASASASPSTLPQVSRAVDRWQASMAMSAAAFIDQSNAKATLSLGHLSQISLMVDSTDKGVASAAVFVQWSTSTRLNPQMARRLKLDARNGVICPVAYVQQPVSFKGCDVIHPAIGIRVQRVRAKDRPIVPEHIVRLRDIYGTCLDASHRHKQAEEEVLLEEPPNANSTCDACDEASADVYLCALCQLRFHWCCSEQCLRMVLTSGQSPLFDLDAALVPSIVKAAVSTTTSGGGSGDDEKMTLDK